MANIGPQNDHSSRAPGAILLIKGSSANLSVFEESQPLVFGRMVGTLRSLILAPYRPLKKTAKSWSSIVVMVRGRSRPLIENHVQPCSAQDQNLSGSSPLFLRLILRTEGESLVRGYCKGACICFVSLVICPGI